MNFKYFVIVNNIFFKQYSWIKSYNKFLFMIKKASLQSCGTVLFCYKAGCKTNGGIASPHWYIPRYTFTFSTALKYCVWRTPSYTCSTKILHLACAKLHVQQKEKWYVYSWPWVDGWAYTTALGHPSPLNESTIIIILW